MTDRKTCNTSIKCSVDTCAYNDHAQNCCSLDSIAAVRAKPSLADRLGNSRVT